MEDDEKQKDDPIERPACTLPPGCRFFPSEQQLLSYYLFHKNSILDDSEKARSVNVISEFDVLAHDPVDLEDIVEQGFEYGAGGRKRHWYFYAPRAARERMRRAAGGGFWRRKGRVKDVVGEGGLVIGTRKKYTFWLRGEARKGRRLTDWVAYEYALVEKDKDFVLCWVFEKSPQKKDASDAHFDDLEGSYLHDSSELASILEEGDFIELDDLLIPLPSSENSGSEHLSRTNE